MLNEIQLTGAGNLVQEAIRDFLRPLLQVLDGSWGKRFVDQTTHARVVGWVNAEQVTLQ
jgi:hypothetical protein